MRTLSMLAFSFAGLFGIMNFSALLREILQSSGKSLRVDRTVASRTAHCNNTTTTRQSSPPFFEEEFPYRLTCPVSLGVEPTGDDLLEVSQPYQIIVGYHVGMVKNWRTIVHDQLRTLSQCGWKNLPIHKFVLSYSNGPASDVLDIFQTYHVDLPQPTDLVESTKSPWEAQIMNELRRQCQAVDKKTVVFYFHNKGASKYSENWRKLINQVWTYSNSLYWRKMMEYFILERPNRCLNKILNDGADTCGVLWREGEYEGYRCPGHYSGNFWVASCDYIVTLPHLPIDDPNQNLTYTAAEFWIGTHYRTRGEKLVSLKNNDIKLYRENFVPEMYWDGFGNRPRPVPRKLSPVQRPGEMK